MKLLKYIPLQLVLFQILGILTEYYLHFSLEFILLLLGLAIIFLVLIYIIDRNKISKNGYFTLVTFLIFFLIGITSIHFKNNLNKKQHYSNFLQHYNTASVEITDVLKPNAYYYNYRATVLQINNNDVLGRIKINIPRDLADSNLKVGNIILVNTPFYIIKKALNPYQFNYKNYLAKQQIHHQITIKPDEYLIIDTTKSLKFYAYKIREKINDALVANGFKGEELAVMNALLLGQRQYISNEVIENYKNAGAMHILALSGLHIGILLLMFNFLLKPVEKLPYGRLIKLFIIVILLWSFAIIAGLSPSIIRAVTMFTAIAISIAVNPNLRSAEVLKALIISAFIILLINPYYLFDVGFQLSYLAVFFIIWLQPLLSRIYKPKLKIVNYIWKLITVSFAAQLGVLPLSIYYFHQFPGLFFISNLLIIPALGIILGAGILIILLALLKILPATLASIYEFIIHFLNNIVGWVAKQESFLFENLSLSIISLIITYILIISFFKWFELRKIYVLKITLVVIIALQLNFIYEKYHTSKQSEFVVFNKSRQSIIAELHGDKQIISHTLPEQNSIEVGTINSYLLNTKSYVKSSIDSLKNIYIFNDKKILVIDSLGIYKNMRLKPDYVLITSSPTINLERLIKTLHPKLIIADASNYKSLVTLWKETCKKYNIKFHYTVTNGAFVEKI